jgi:hypothetical protein
MLLSSLFDIPAQLALVLSLAASTAAYERAGPSATAAPVVPAQVLLVAEPLEGPFRFGARNWLRTLKEDMPQGASPYASRIFKTSGGRYYVPAHEDRRRILMARHDQGLAHRAAKAAARRNAQRLGAGLHRSAGAGDLYIAHLFGPEAAIHFILQAEARPGASAALQVPALKTAVPELFRTDGERLTLQQAYARFAAPFKTYAPGTRPNMNMPGAQSRLVPPPMPAASNHALARTTFAPSAIEWRPQVSAAGTSTNQ